MLAIVEAYVTWKRYMKGTAFLMTVYTDHIYLEYLLARYRTDV